MARVSDNMFYGTTSGQGINNLTGQMSHNVTNITIMIYQYYLIVALLMIIVLMLHEMHIDMNTDIDNSEVSGPMDL
jgi:hypothetical protein